MEEGRLSRVVKAKEKEFGMFVEEAQGGKEIEDCRLISKRRGSEFQGQDGRQRRMSKHGESYTSRITTSW